MTVRPADLIEDQLQKFAEDLKEYAKSERRYVNVRTLPTTEKRL